MGKIGVAVIGATGIVGQRMVNMLTKHPWFDLQVITASDKSVGKKYKNATKWVISAEPPSEVKEYAVLETDPKVVEHEGNNIKIVFSAIPSQIAREIEPKFASEGFAVSSNASAYRMDPTVPLVIPEVNPDHLKLIDIQKELKGWDGFIITDPNCSTIILAIPLKPLLDNFGLERVYVSTMQAISGAGLSGIFAMSIFDNVIPYISGEEEKMETEPLKILGSLKNKNIEKANFTISASCHRVTTLEGHLEAIFASLKRECTIEEVKNVLRAFKGIAQKYSLPSAPKNPIIVREEIDRPQPRLDRDAENGMAITVGRIRADKSNPRGIKFLTLGHNTIRGAAGATILNAELLVKMNYV